MILSLTQDIVFEYKGRYYCINPHNKNYFTVGTEDDVIEYDNINNVMSDLIYSGDCLNDIASEIKLA